MFGEKKEEFSKGKKLPVWQSPKYVAAKTAALEVIKDGRYGLSEADFWILMNETKNGQMGYTGLIISHNGCLKINDALPPEKRFVPSCVPVPDKDGYGGSLVYTYINDEQGIYEVGEVNAANCKLAYPYAMAYKRLFDRVVLKNSKLSYAGIYSEVEADEFAAKEEPSKEEEVIYVCGDCKHPIEDYTSKDGITLTAEDIALHSKEEFGAMLCASCIKARRNADKQS